MAPTKLTNSQKETIFQLYRATDATTSTLSRDYGVSVSTISRLLKSKLPAQEYERLVRIKRSGVTRSTANEVEEVEPPSTSDVGIEAEISDRPPAQIPPASPPLTRKAEITPSVPEPLSTPGPTLRQTLSGEERRRRRRSSAQGSFEPVTPLSVDQPRLDFPTTEPTPNPPEAPTPIAAPVPVKPKLTLAAPIPQIFDDAEEDDEEAPYVYGFGEEEFSDEDEEEDEDEDEDEDELSLNYRDSATELIEIVPLSEADLPRSCYCVVDRTAELVTCRLQDFQELGRIPDSEAHHRTLPLFQNQRVARRFSRRNQRVIKVPDGKMVQKTAPYLEAKGITRLLLDGKVYSLS